MNFKKFFEQYKITKEFIDTINSVNDDYFYLDIEEIKEDVNFIKEEMDFIFDFFEYESNEKTISFKEMAKEFQRLYKEEHQEKFDYDLNAWHLEFIFSTYRPHCDFTTAKEKYQLGHFDGSSRCFNIIEFDNKAHILSYFLNNDTSYGRYINDLINSNTKVVFDIDDLTFL